MKCGLTPHFHPENIPFALLRRVVTPKKEIVMRAYSFRQALNAGCEPREYKEFQLEGEADAFLDFRIWGKTPCLHCYFSEFSTNRKFVLTAFNRQEGQQLDKYSARDQAIDFSAHDLEGSCYHLVTQRGARGGIVWENAKLIPCSGRINGAE